jgi:hypothetical protein
MIMASNLPTLLLIPTLTSMLIFPTYQIAFAQENATEPTPVNQNTISFNTIIAGIVSGGVIGAAATLIGTYLNNRHNINLKKQELKHDLAIELFKHRIESYAVAFEITEQANRVTEVDKFQKLSKQLYKWYNNGKGGLLMSATSTRKYEALSGEILSSVSNIVSKKTSGESSLINIWNKAEQFRASLQNDIGVREELPKS